jgi:hypothetical protein
MRLKALASARAFFFDDGWEFANHEGTKDTKVHRENQSKKRNGTVSNHREGILPAGETY